MKTSFQKIAAVLISVAIAAPALAATTTPQAFDVTVTLTSKCEITSGPTPVAFTYTSFQAAAAPSTGGAFNVRCTNSLPYSLSLSTTTGSVIGLAYTLAVPTATQTGNGLAGTAYTVTGSMAGGQAGTCSVSAGCTATVTGAATVTVTY